MNNILQGDIATHLKIGRDARAAGDRQAALQAFQTAGALDPANVEIQIEIANDLKALNRLAAAEAIYLSVQQRNEGHLAATIGLAQIKSLQKDQSASLALFEHAATIARQHVGVKLEIGRLLRELGRIEEAGAALRQLLEQDPQNVNGHVGLALVKRRQGDRAASLELLQAASKLAPQHSGIRLEMATDLRELGRLDEAESILQKLRQQEPQSFGALIGLGHVKRRQADRSAALSYFEQASSLNPHHIGLKIEIANDQRELGRLVDAERSLRSALQIDPTHGHAHGQHGALLRHMRRYQEALSSFKAAAQCEPGNPRFQIEIANCYREIGELENAEAILARVVDEHADNAQAAIALSVLFVESYRLDRAKAVLENALGRNPAAELYLALGRLYRRLDDRSLAFNAFEQALEISPDNDGAALEIIEEHRVRGDFVRAHQLSDELIAKKTSLGALLHRGRIFRDQEDHAAALKSFSEAAERFPNAWQPKLETAVEYRRLGQPTKSKRILSEVLEHDEWNIGALDRMIEHFILAEELEDALRTCLKAIEARPNLCWPYLKAAQVSARLGQLDSAWSYLDEASRNAGSHPEIEATRIELLRLVRKFEDAEKTFTRLSTAQRTNLPILIQGVQSAISFGDLDLARERLAGFNPQTALSASAVTELRGKIAQTAWKFGEAIEHYEAALRVNPANARTHWELAKCRLLMLQPSVARDHLKRFVQLSASATILKNSPHNLSQNHIGQLIDEFVLDTRLLSQLQASESDQADPDARLARLYEIVLENPDHTPSAITLLLALRMEGKLTSNIEAGSIVIPRSIVQFWDHPSPPSEISELMATWRDRNPGYVYQLFDGDSAAAFLKTHHTPDTRAAFHHARQPAQQADIFRLAYLATHGGFYADCDDRCATKLETFVPARASFVSFQEEYGTLGNNFIGASANHPVICRALDLAVEAVNRGDRDFIWFSTGPGLLTRAFASVVAEAPDEHLPKSAIFTAGQIQRWLGMHCPLLYKATYRSWLKSSFLSKPKLASKATS